jgi:hypothetical protein
MDKTATGQNFALATGKDSFASFAVLECPQGQT